MKIDINQRIHGIDALRGIAMLLGILLHATIAYKEQPLPTWPNDTGYTHPVFDYLYFVVHSFRMPLFFLIAGYFCRFLYHRIGEKEFISHRVKRILVPFLVSMVIILPLTIFPFLYFRFSYLGDTGKIIRASFNQMIGWNGMAHLWFLYFLLIYYFIVVVLFRIIRSAPVREHFARLSETVSRFRLDNYVAAMIAALPLALILLMVPEMFLHVDTGIIPGLPYLGYFGYFFFLGWLVNRGAQASFSWMARHTWPLLAAGVILSVFLFWLDFTGRYHRSSGQEEIGIKVLAALQTICLVFGSIGFFLRFWQSESRVWKYVSDASYWMYLIHLMLVAFGQVLFIGVPVSGFVKFLVILSATMFITLATYHYFIRFTVIGEWLHGKRKR